MSALTPALRTILFMAAFLATVYVTYLRMYLAPMGHLRHWGAATWWLLIRLGTARVIRIDGMAEVHGYHPTPAAGFRRQRFRTPWSGAYLPRRFWVRVTLCLALALGIGLTLSVRPSAGSIPSAQKAYAEQNLAETIPPAQNTCVEQDLAETILWYLDTWREDDDPLVTLPQGAQAKASNYYGVEVGGARYYYQVTHHVSFDPWRLGRVADYEVVSVLSPHSPDEVIIYRIK